MTAATQRTSGGGPAGRPAGEAPGLSPAPGTLSTDRNGRRGWWLSPRLLRAFAAAAVVANGLIAVTGATVRVTGSGLGCEIWPECQPGTLIPEYRQGLAGVHQAIEFTNRTFTGLVLIASLGTFLLLWLHRRDRADGRQLLALGAAGPIGVLLQAIWGGVVVRLELQWWTVAPHLLVSLVLVGLALVTAVRIAEPDTPAHPVVPRPLSVLSWSTLGVLTLLCIAGTLVTAAGPHGGDVDTPRLGLSVRTLAQIHADLMFGYLGLLIALVVGFVAVKAPLRLRRRGYLLAGLTAGQGVLGLVQFAIGVPEVLVVLHVLGAVAVVTAAVWMVLATRERRVQPATAVTNGGRPSAADHAG